MTLGVEPLRTTTLVDAAAYRIQKAILDGELPPGAELRQEELCRTLGISRTPLREALRRIEGEGLIVLQANRTAVVRRLDRNEIADLYDIRAYLEGLACHRASKRLTPGDVTSLREAQADLEAASNRWLDSRAELDEAAQVSAHEALRNANDRFHEAVINASGSPMLASLITSLWNRFPKDHAWRGLAGQRDAVHTLNVTQHRAILDPLVNGDAETASIRMSEHIRHSGDLLIKYLETHEFWSVDQTAGSSKDKTQTAG